MKITLTQTEIKSGVIFYKSGGRFEMGYGDCATIVYNTGDEIDLMFDGNEYKVICIRTHDGLIVKGD